MIRAMSVRRSTPSLPAFFVLLLAVFHCATVRAAGDWRQGEFAFQRVHGVDGVVDGQLDAVSRGQRDQVLAAHDLLDLEQALAVAELTGPPPLERQLLALARRLPEQDAQRSPRARPLPRSRMNGRKNTKAKVSMKKTSM